uniref:Uncharacterized protein n=1 Tax=Fagus sylvatica TaxID=28930 RepID=A0A2N9HFH7_FAGSY
MRQRADIHFLVWWRATIALRDCGKAVKKLLEHGFCGLALHNKRREPTSEPAGVALRGFKTHCPSTT